MNKLLHTSGISAIVAAILSFFLIFLLPPIVKHKTVTIPLLALIILVLNCSIFLGFLIIANKNYLLVGLVIAFGVASILLSFINLLNIYNPNSLLTTNFIISIVFGALNILFGVSILKIKYLPSVITKGLSLLFIVNGIIHVSFLLLLLVPMINIAISFLEAKLFFSAARHHNKGVKQK